MEKFKIDKIEKQYRKEIEKALRFYAETEDKLYVVICNMKDMQTGESVQQWYLYKDLADVERVFGLWRGFYSQADNYEEIEMTEEKMEYRYQMRNGHYCWNDDTVYKVA